MAFIQLTSPLILAGDPTLPNHAATKQYVDFKANNIDAAGFSSGLLNVMRLPALVGDVTMAAGSGTLVLPPSGVVPGTYTKVVLSTSGRVTTGGVLAAEDMPNISWNKITSGLPTTLAGYGISNVIGMSGGTITGTLSSSAVPSASLHLVTKSYVDSMIQTSGDSLVTGDVVRKGITGIPSGFLRTNGAKVSKTTYAALYSVLGDRYQVILQDGSESPWRNQSSINRAGVLNPMSARVSTFAANIGYEKLSSSFVTKNRVYFANAPEGSYPTPNFKVGVINPDGTLANCVNVDIIPTGTLTYAASQSFFFTKNKVWWLLRDNSGGGRMFKTAINSDGTVNRFTLHATSPWLTWATKVVRVKNRVYLFDVQLAGSSGPMEYGFAYLDANEDVGSVNSIGNVNSDIARNAVIDAFVHKNKLYLLTYKSTDNLTYTIRPFYASINSDGTLGSWTMGPTFTVPYAGTTRGSPAGGKVLNTTSGLYYLAAGTGEYLSYQAVPGDPESWYSVLTYPLMTYQMNMDANGVMTSWGAPVKNLNPGVWENSFPPKMEPFFTSSRMYLPGSGHNNQSASFVNFDFSGGTNDYSPYYDGTYLGVDPNNFYLPDFTSKETNNTKYYVKT